MQTANDGLEALRPIDPRAAVAEPSARGSYGAPRVSPDAEDADRAAVLELLGHTAVPVDEIVGQSHRPPAIAQTVLLELELAGRNTRHAGGQVSLEG